MIGAALGIAVLVILAVSVYGSFEITKIPYLAVPYTPREFGWTYEEVFFLSHDGLRLAGWFIPAAEPSETTLVILHGFGSNSGDMLPNTACLKREGRWNLLYVDFRGHGGSAGRHTSLGPMELRDFFSALAYLREHKPDASRRVGVYGHSLGGAVAIVAAARRPDLQAVAAESPFCTIADTVRHFAWIYYGIPYFPFMPLALAMTSLRLRMRIGTFSPLREIGRIAPRPIFLIHGGRDLRMPPAETKALWEAAGEPKEQWSVPGADHGEPWMLDQEGYEKRLAGFFNKAFQGRPI